MVLQGAIQAFDISKRVRGKFSKAPALFPLVFGTRQRALFARWTLEKMHLQDYGEVCDSISVSIIIIAATFYVKTLPDTRLCQ